MRDGAICRFFGAELRRNCALHKFAPQAPAKRAIRAPGANKIIDFSKM